MKQLFVEALVKGEWVVEHGHRQFYVGAGLLQFEASALAAKLNKLASLAEEVFSD